MGTEQHPINHLLLTSCQASLAIKVQHPVNHLTTIENTKATIMAATQNMTSFRVTTNSFIQTLLACIKLYLSLAWSSFCLHERFKMFPQF